LESTRVEDQLDGGVGRIGGIEKLEECDELAAAMAILGQGMDRAGDEIDARQQGYGAVAGEGHACVANLAQGTVCKILDQEEEKPHPFDPGRRLCSRVPD
jgi:hypothetical protein